MAKITVLPRASEPSMPLSTCRRPLPRILPRILPRYGLVQGPVGRSQRQLVALTQPRYTGVLTSSTAHNPGSFSATQWNYCVTSVFFLPLHKTVLVRYDILLSCRCQVPTLTSLCGTSNRTPSSIVATRTLSCGCLHPNSSTRWRWMLPIFSPPRLVDDTREVWLAFCGLLCAFERPSWLL